MKKTIFIVLLLCISSSSFSQDVINNLTVNFFHLGIKEIDLKKTEKGSEYSFVSFKKSYINNVFIDAKRFKVVSIDKTFFLQDELNSGINDNYSITVNDKKEISNIATPTYQGRIENIDQKLFDDVNFVFLYLFSNELFNDLNSPKISYDTFSRTSVSASGGGAVGCSFWDTYYSVGVGMSEAGAISHLNYVTNQAIQNGDLNGCTLISKKAEVDSYMGVHVATITWCCN